MPTIPPVWWRPNVSDAARAYAIDLDAKQHRAPSLDDAFRAGAQWEGARGKFTDRDRWLAESAERILEVMDYASNAIALTDGRGVCRNPDRERARVEAVKEMVRRFKALVEA